MNLELMALKWLRFERGCMIVLSERSPRAGYCGQPDALGITPARYLYEVEVKRSMADFYADFHKRSRRFRDERPELYPKEFHYLAEPELAAKIALSEKLPAHAGVLTTDGWRIKCVNAAEINRASKRLSLKECVRLAHQLANHLLASEQRFESLVCNWRSGHDPVPWSRTIDYQI